MSNSASAFCIRRWMLSVGRFLASYRVTFFLGCGFAAKYREGGGNFSVPLQWMLGLRRLKLDAIWLELLPGTDDVLADQSKIRNFQRQLRAHGLAGRYCLLYQKPAADTHDLDSLQCIGISKRELLERLSGPNVLLNLAYSIHPPLLLKFERRIFCDLDPSEIFYWMTKMEVGQSCHHEFWTIGLNVHGRRLPAAEISASPGKHFIRSWTRNCSGHNRGRAHRNSLPSVNGIGVGRWRSPANFRICPKDLPSNLIYAFQRVCPRRGLSSR